MNASASVFHNIHWIRGRIHTLGIGFNWDQGKRWMGVCIEAFRLLFVWFEVYTYVSIWLIQIHWHICIQKVFGVSRRFSHGSRGTRNMFPLFFCSSDFFIYCFFRNMQFGEYWGSVRPYDSLSDCLVKADKIYYIVVVMIWKQSVKYKVAKFVIYFSIEAIEHFCEIFKKKFSMGRK